MNGTYKITVYAEDIDELCSLPIQKTVRQSGLPETKGDLDGDKKLTLTDALMALKLIAGDALTIPVSHSDADMNEDDRIGSEEAVYILKRIAK